MRLTALLRAMTCRRKSQNLIWCIKALADLGRAPHEACLIGDSKADLGAAKAAGVTSILVSFGYAGDLDVYHCGADRVIHDLMELIVNDT